MDRRHDVVVIGAGQAGLATSRELRRADVDHTVLERRLIGDSWRRRWDSFCLVTPNWSVQLPGLPYDGPDPDGFGARDRVVAFLERYAAMCAGPVEEGVDVTALRVASRDGFELETSAGRIAAASVVLCTGAYQRPHRPAAAATLPPDLLQIDVNGYRNPGDLPAGPVLVIGSGQSGCQIAEELHESGRTVFLSCGRAPWAPRRIGGRDLVWWLHESGFLDAPVSSLPNPAARLAGNVLTSGRDGGHDLHLRPLQRMGVTLLGHFLGADGGHARFAPDLDAIIAWSDARHADLLGLFRRLARERGMPAPDVPEAAPLATAAPEELRLRGLGAVIFAGGFRPAYSSWVDVPGAFDELGFPIHDDGASTAAPGLYFVGVHFLRKRQSSLLIGVGEDAEIVAGRIAAGAPSTHLVRSHRGP